MVWPTPQGVPSRQPTRPYRIKREALDAGLNSQYFGNGLVWSETLGFRYAPTVTGTKLRQSKSGANLGFGATLGVATTDKIVAGTDPSMLGDWFTVFTDFNLNGQGGGNIGRLYQVSDGTSDVTSGLWLVSGKMALARLHSNSSTNFAQWSANQTLATGTDYRLSLELNQGIASSTVVVQPIFELNGLSVATQDIQANTFSFADSIGANWNIGNRPSDNARNWDGTIGNISRFVGDRLTKRLKKLYTENPYATVELTPKLHFFDFQAASNNITQLLESLSTAAFSLTTAIPLAVAIASSSAVSAELASATSIDSSVSSQTVVTSDLTTAIPLASTQISVSTIAVDLQVPTITIREDYERSSVKLANSSVTGSGSSAVISLRPRLQASEVTTGAYAWLEPSARIDNVNTFNPTFYFEPYTGSGVGYYGNPWQSGRKPHFSYDQITWYPFDNVTVDTGNNRIEFRHNTGFTQNTVYVGRGRQQTVHNAGNWVASLETSYASKIHVTEVGEAYTPSGDVSGYAAQDFIANEIGATVDELGRTIPKTPVYAFEIRDDTLSPVAGNAKRWAAFYGGVHAGEDHADYMLKAFVAALLSGSANATKILKEYRILILPLINTDGRSGGGWRGTYKAIGGIYYDPNRQYHNTITGLDVVNNTRSVLEGNLSSFNHPDLFIDFHATYYGTWEMFSDDTNYPQAGRFRTLFQTAMGVSVPNNGSSPAGSTVAYMRTRGTKCAITYETGDISPITDTQVTNQGVAMVEAWSQAIDQSLFTVITNWKSESTVTFALTDAPSSSNQLSVSTVTAALTTAIPLESAETSTSSVTANLDTAVALSTQQFGYSTVTYTLTTAIQLAQDITSHSTVTVDLLTGGALDPALFEAKSTVTYQLTTAIPLISSIESAAVITYALETASSVSSQLVSQSVASYELTTAIPLIAQQQAGSSISVDFTTGIPLSSAVASVSSVTYNLDTGTGLSCSQQSVSTLSLELTTGVSLVQNISSNSTASYILTNVIPPTRTTYKVDVPGIDYVAVVPKE